MTTPLHTLAAAATLTQDIRKSRFIAHAAALTAPSQAPELLARVSDPAATHNCWAWRAGQQYRFSDDNEPGGTAGRPILQAIDGQGMDNVLVVVTRHFGGIKLGAGGLMRAYGGCAAECLRLAPKLPIILCAEVWASCDFATLPILYSRLGDYAAEKLDERYTADGVELRLRLPEENSARLAALVRDLTRGRGGVRVAE